MNYEYKKVINEVLEQGHMQNCRNGKQIIIPFYAFSLDFRVQSPKLTLRKMWYNGVDGEFKTLISEEPLTNVKQFEENGCNYWKLWSGSDGSINIDYANQMHPQLENLIDDILSDSTSRRLMIDLWVPENVRDGSLSLPCCWHNLTFSVIDNVLHLKWTQRSVDVMLGLPADIYLAYKFMEFVADKTNLKVGSCLFSLSNVHIYEEHIDGAKALLGNTSRDASIKINFELKE